MRILTKMFPLRNEVDSEGGSFDNMGEEDFYETFDDGVEVNLGDLEGDFMEELDVPQEEASGEEVEKEVVENEEPKEENKEEVKAEESSEEEKGLEDMSIEDILNIKEEESEQESAEPNKYEVDDNPFYKQSQELGATNKTLEDRNQQLETQLKNYEEHINKASHELQMVNEFNNLLTSGDIGQFKALIQAQTGINLDEYQTTQYTNNQTLIDTINNNRVQRQIQENKTNEIRQKNQEELQGFVQQFKQRHEGVTDSDVLDLIKEMQTNTYNNPEILYTWKNLDKIKEQARREGIEHIQKIMKKRKTNSYKSSAQGKGATQREPQVPSSHIDDASDVVTLEELRNLKY